MEKVITLEEALKRMKDYILENLMFRRLFVHDNRMFAERAFYCYTEKFFVDIINMTYSCRVVLDMICMECGNYEDR